MNIPYVVVATAHAQLREALETFRRLGCRVATAVSRTDCLFKLRAHPPDLLVLAPPLFWEPKAGAAETIQRAAARASVPVLMLDRPVRGDSWRAALEYVAVHLADVPSGSHLRPVSAGFH